MTRPTAKTALLTGAAFFALAPGGALADDVTDAVIRDLQRDGYQRIHIRRSDERLYVSAESRGRDLDMVVDRASGRVLERDEDVYHDEDRGNGWLSAGYDDDDDYDDDDYDDDDYDDDDYDDDRDDDDDYDDDRDDEDDDRDDDRDDDDDYDDDDDDDDDDDNDDDDDDDDDGDDD